MKPLAQLAATGVRAVLFDVDDTVTTHGKLTAEAFGAVEALHLAGLRTIAVTGRAAGFCEYAARLWPVDAVVGENGGFSFRFAEGKLHRDYREPADARARNRDRYAAIARSMLDAVPGCALAPDHRYHETDLAIDYAEEVRGTPETAERVAAVMRSHGMHVATSSIHVHGWFADYDKRITTCDLLDRQFHLDPACAVFVGDSPNDASMFAFFPKSVGVANVRDYAGRMPAEPAYVTQAAFGGGFAELTAHLLRR